MKKTGRAFVIVSALTLVAALLPVDGSSQAQQQFRMIVHPSNSVTSLSADQISAIFLKEIKSWPGTSQLVEPIDQKVESEVRESFSEQIHGRSARSIYSNWMSRVFSGRPGEPPLVKGSDEEVVAFVQSKPNAIGYVSLAADIKGVKVIEVR